MMGHVYGNIDTLCQLELEHSTVYRKEGKLQRISLFSSSRDM